MYHILNQITDKHVFYPYIREIIEVLELWCPSEYQAVRKDSPDYFCYFTKKPCDINWCTCCISNKYKE